MDDADAARLLAATPVPAQSTRLNWPTTALQQALAGLGHDVAVDVVPTIDSTNSELMRRARAGDERPCLLVAEHQSAGRGRLGRQWLSGSDAPEGGAAGAMPSALTFSFGTALAPVSWSGLSLAVGVAVARALHPRLELKWPNDIWLDGRKMAGILIETASSATPRYAVVGIGINIAPRAASALVPSPAWLQELSPGCDPPGVLMRIVPELARALALFEAQGFGPFRDAFSQRDLLRGRSVVLSDGTDGIAQGVDEEGALLVQVAGGLRVVTSAEISVRPAAAS